MTPQYDGQQIFTNFRKGPGTGGIGGSAEILGDVALGYHDLAHEVRQLVRELESAWEGAAGAGARRRVRPVAIEHELAARELSIAEDLANRQVGSFIEARNRVEPVPPAPTEVNPWRLASPEHAASYVQQLHAHHTAAQHNVDVMDGYSRASEHNTVHLPMSYGTLTSAGVTLGQAGAWIDGPDSAEPAPGGARDASGPDPRGATVSPPVEPTRAEPATQPERAALPTDPPNPAAPAPTAKPEPATAAAEAPPAGFTTAQAGGVAPSGVSPQRLLSPVPMPDPPAAAGTSTPTPTPRLTAEPRQGTASGTQPRAGTSRGSTMSGLPVGAQRRDDDTDRRAPDYLREPDPEALFGGVEVVAPATIGLDEN
ncbi:hypothetical protein [Actinophytocola sediminis]